ncbi:cysteine desulfurase, partial [Streptococcus pneumoniae]|nr:cysteine desulfurase [Streptococcus pneumoniae]
ILNRGLDYGEDGNLHARLTVAMPKSVLEEVCQRIVTTFATL